MRKLKHLLLLITIIIIISLAPNSWGKLQEIKNTQMSKLKFVLPLNNSQKGPGPANRLLSTEVNDHAACQGVTTSRQKCVLAKQPQDNFNWWSASGHAGKFNNENYYKIFVFLTSPLCAMKCCSSPGNEHANLDCEKHNMSLGYLTGH